MGCIVRCEFLDLDCFCVLLEAIVVGEWRHVVDGCRETTSYSDGKEFKTSICSGLWCLQQQLPVPFSSTLHVTTSSEHLPSFHDIFIHITYVPKPLRPHVPFCPASPSIGVVHLASSPLAAASRRSTHPSPLAHPPHFANGTPAQATSENRSVKELDRSCSTSLLDLTRGAEDAERPCAM